MKRNTSCGCNDHNHHGCPPQPDCDKARSITSDCVAVPFIGGDEETTVVLADVELQALVEANIKLPSFARDIKQIRKNVKLTQCKAIPAGGNPNAVKLFVEGVVHKNIQFVEDCNGWVRDFSVEIPFRCHRAVSVFNPPVFPFGEFSVKNNVFERRELAKDGHGADRCTTGSLSFEVFNEPIQCKLLAAAVNQLDTLQDFDNWGRFDKIEEKMEVFLIIKLFQKQQAPFVPPTPFPTPTIGDGSAATFSQPSQLTIFDRFRQIIGQ